MALSGAVQSRLLTMRAAFSPSKLRNRSTWRAQVADPLGDGLLGVQRALGGRARVADESGGSADESERPVPGELQPAHQQQLDEVAEVQARRRRVEAAVVRDRIAREQLAQSRLIGGDVHEAAPDDLVPDVLERRVVGGRGRGQSGRRHALQATSGATDASARRGPLDARGMPRPDTRAAARAASPARDTLAACS